MKHIKLAAAAAFVLGIGAAGSASADQGIVRFHGKVGDQTCVVEGGNGTDLGGPNRVTVILDDVQQSQLNAAGATAGAKPFTLEFKNGENGMSCATADLSSGTFRFLGRSQPVDGFTGNLNNSLVGGAQNVQLQLLTEDGNPIDLRDHAPENVAFEDDEIAKLHYQVQYIATGVATPGDVESHVLFETTYR